MVAILVAPHPSSAAVGEPVGETVGETVVCPGCGAVVDVEAGHRTTLCVYCATPGVILRPRQAGVAEPALMTPFVVGKSEAVAAVKQWQKTRSIFAHSGVKHASIEVMRGVYVPAWLYSCVARTHYQARIGEHYQETESYTTTENGKTVRRTRTVTKTEWRDLAGEHATYLTDVLVTASRGVPNRELERVEPFDMRGLRRHDPQAVVGWLMEEPSIGHDEGLGTAHGEANAQTQKTLSAFMPGDHHAGLTLQNSFENESLDLVVVPLWVMAVRYDNEKPALRVIVNGTTKKVGGDTPWSKAKITAAIVTGLVLIGAAAFVGWRLGWFR